MLEIETEAEIDLQKAVEDFRHDLNFCDQGFVIVEKDVDGAESTHIKTKGQEKADYGSLQFGEYSMLRVASQTDKGDNPFKFSIKDMAAFKEEVGKDFAVLQEANKAKKEGATGIEIADLVKDFKQALEQLVEEKGALRAQDLSDVKERVLNPNLTP